MYEELARIAAAQDGVVGENDIDRLGLTAWRRRRLFDSAWLRCVAPGAYAINGVPDSHRFRLRVGLVSLGPESRVSFEAAATLHGLDRSRSEAVEFTVPRSRRRSAASFRVHTTKFMPSIDSVIVDGLPVMSATRTILDLALARAHVRRIEAAIDSAVRLGLSSPEVIRERLQTLRGSGRWGSRRIDALLADSGGHTMLERRFLELVRSAGLPRPRTQVVHRRDGRHVARVDFLFPDHGVVVEVSGRKGHSSPSERARDAQRRNELQELGRKVYEYTWDDVTQAAVMVMRTLRRRLEDAS